MNLVSRRQQYFDILTGHCFSDVFIEKRRTSTWGAAPHLTIANYVVRLRSSRTPDFCLEIIPTSKLADGRRCLIIVPLKHTAVAMGSSF